MDKVFVVVTISTLDGYAANGFPEETLTVTTGVFKSYAGAHTYKTRIVQEYKSKPGKHDHYVEELRVGE